jgi:hypothetical protein
MSAANSLGRLPSGLDWRSPGHIAPKKLFHPSFTFASFTAMKLNFFGVFGAVLGAALGAGLAYSLIPAGETNKELIVRTYSMFAFGGLVAGAIICQVIWEVLLKRR